MISILCPSRARPKYAKRMIDTAFDKAGNEIEVKLYLNEDDSTLCEYTDNIDSSMYIIGPNQSTSYSWNLLAEKSAKDILFLVGDDCHFVTQNWVNLVLNAFEKYPDKIACVYPSTPGRSNDLNPHFCLHKNWVNTLGYFIPPYFYHWYVDTWIAKVARLLNRFHLLSEFELPIEKIKDRVHSDYHNSWLRKKDDYVWSVSKRHIEADFKVLEDFIKNYK